MVEELEENPAQGLISTHLSPFSLCQVAGPRGLCECVFGVGLSIPEGVFGMMLLKEGAPHPEQTSPLTWAPASQGHSSDSAQYLADRPLQASSGGTAACSSRQRYQVGSAVDTGFRSSLARRTHSCLCLQSMVHSACSGHSWEEKEFKGNTGEWMQACPPRPPGALENRSPEAANTARVNKSPSQPSPPFCPASHTPSPFSLPPLLSLRSGRDGPQ